MQLSKAQPQSLKGQQQGVPACSDQGGNLALREGARFRGTSESSKQPLTSAFPAGILSSLYTQQNDFGLLGLELTNYVNFIQI